MSQERHEIAIVTDSTSDLPVEVLERYDIHVVPLYVLWGGQQLREGVDIDEDTFYRRIRTDPEHPTTSQPTPADFVNVLRRIDAKQVVIITIASALSGTYNSAIAARDSVDIPVRVIDSYAVSLAMGWQVLAAARARERGGDLDAIIAEAQRVRGRLLTYFTVDTLEYLHRGGRIGGAARLLGTALQLKPLLTVDTTTGRVDAVERIRTRKRAMARLLEVISEGADRSRPIHVGVLHAAAPEDAAYLAEQMQTTYDVEELLVQQLTPVLGIHGGPGLVGISAWQG